MTSIVGQGQRSSPGSSPRPAETPDPRRWRALTVCLIAGFMTLLDISIVNVALPSIRVGLHASESDLQWVVSGYALTFGLVLVPSGRFGDARGRRTAFMAGLVLFTATSAAAGLATGPTWLSVARLMQGAAGGLLNPQIAGLIQQLFRGPERGKAFGLFGATIGVSTAVGPLLGGAIIRFAGAAEGWRWVFYVNVPIGVLALVLAWWLVPAAVERERRRHSLDLFGVFLLGVGMVALLLPFVEEQQWHGAGKWALVPVAAALLAAFVAWEHRYAAQGREPTVDLRLFRTRSYSLGSALALLYFAGFTGIFFIFTLYLQNGLGYSALLAGAAITPFALGSAVSAAVGGRTVARYGRPLVTGGLLLVVIGLGLTYLAVHLEPGHSVAAWTAAPLLLAGIGSGLVIPPNQTLTLSEVPVRYAGSAAGVLQTGQRIGSSVGIAAAGSVFFSTITASHGDWAEAFRHGLRVVLGFVFLALLLALADLVAGRRHTRRARHARQEDPASASASDDVGISVRGRVRDAAGSAVRDAALTLLDPGGRQVGRAVTGDDGGYRIEVPGAGTYVLIASADGHRPQAVTVTVGDGPLDRDVVLTDGSRLSGTVRAADGRPVPRARVTLLDATGNVCRVATTDARGGYVFDDLPAGDYTVTATAYPPATTTLQVADGQHLDQEVWLGYPDA